MPTIAELEQLLARCARVLHEHDKTAMELGVMPDSPFKREMLAKFEASLRMAAVVEKATHAALDREREKMN